ncbi:protein DOUBLE-STRAND BREAK FORMATION-like [Phragmites australis]|uniref:protein DOUBLE-STRAND BREAK FORMATION-like n=1 Tax=Phragmites australis TaxID=29695 RepID=UPI002D7778F2|nr:protein DOUBLE-STRAND BREAK FORMATION-like [Phragmites australis]
MVAAEEEEERDAAIPEPLSLFASCLSQHRFGDQELRVLEAALSAGGDVPALLATRAEARCLLRASAVEAFPATGPVEEDGRRFATADFFARAFALVGDVESCLAMKYEALVLRESKYSDDHHLQVSHDEWLTFAKDSLDNGFYTIASKAFANALAHIRPSHARHLDSANSIQEKDRINNITGLQNLAKSLSAQHSVQTQSAEYMKRRTSGVHEKCNLQPGKPKLPGSSMFRLGIKTRNIKKLLRSQERNLDEI